MKKKQVSVTTNSNTTYTCFFTEVLTGVHVASIEDAKVAAQKLLEKGCKKVIVTLGSNGSLIYGPDQCEHVPAIKVTNVVDTTGAGDAFVGTVAHFIANGIELKKAVEYATFACSLSIQKPGAQGSYPDGEQVYKNYNL